MKLYLVVMLCTFDNYNVEEFIGVYDSELKAIEKIHNIAYKEGLVLSLLDSNSKTYEIKNLGHNMAFHYREITVNE